MIYIMWTFWTEIAQKRLEQSQIISCFFRCILQLTWCPFPSKFYVCMGISFRHAAFFCRIKWRNTQSNHVCRQKTFSSSNRDFQHFPLTDRERKIIIEKLSGCSAAGSAHGSGPWGRGFKSRHSDQIAKERVFRYPLLCSIFLYFTEISKENNEKLLSFCETEFWTYLH